MTKKWSSTKSGDGLTKRAASKQARKTYRIATDAEIAQSRAELRAGNEAARELWKDVKLDPRIAAARREQ